MLKSTDKQKSCAVLILLKAFNNRVDRRNNRSLQIVATQFLNVLLITLRNRNRDISHSGCFRFNTFNVIGILHRSMTKQFSLTAKPQTMRINHVVDQWYLRGIQCDFCGQMGHHLWSRHNNAFKKIAVFQQKCFNSITRIQYFNTIKCYVIDPTVALKQTHRQEVHHEVASGKFLQDVVHSD